MYLLIITILLAASLTETPDIILRGGLVIDGSGLPGVNRDVAIKGDRIISVGGQFQAGPQTRVIDVSNRIVCPGFIDLHSHSDDSILAAPTRSNLNYLTQGVTTIVTGNCGFGPVLVKDYYAAIDRNNAGTNVCHLIPHNTVRRVVMGNVNRAPSAAELAKMTALVEAAMKDGAWGISTGLIYTPGSYAAIDELQTLSKVVSRYQGIYATHMRNEGDEVLAAIEEALTIGATARLPVHISHLKVSGRSAWGKASLVLSRLEQARRSGQAVTADQYPYAASSTSLQATVIPARYREGTVEENKARWKDPVQGPALRKAVEENIAKSDQGRAIRIARYTPQPAWQGMSLAAIAGAEKRSMVELVQEIESRGGAQIVHFSMNEEDVRLIARQDYVATASDGSALVPDSTVPHPRCYGTFSRKIGRYAVEEKLLPLEQAVRSATGLPADILQLPQRGYLKPGFFADIVVLDPDAYRDRSTYDKPHQYSTGIDYLLINGRWVINQGTYQNTLAGKALRHAISQP